MKFFKILLLAALLAGKGLPAQIADSLAHAGAIEQFRGLYNDRQFKVIFDNMSPAFRAVIDENNFTNLLNNSIYSTFGQMTSAEYLERKKEFYTYIAYFKNGKLVINLAVNAAGQTDGIQFLPYEDAPKTRRNAYNSDNEKQSALDSLVDKSVRSFMQSPQNCGLSLGVLMHGKTYFYNYGETRRSSNSLPNNTTIYEIGSITKTFCGLLLAHAVIEKKLKLDDDIRRYLPGKYPNLAWSGKAILIKHLANHTSGLESVPANISQLPGFDSLNPYKNYTRGQLFDYLALARPKTEPGTVFDYSNMGMALMGLILENVYKQPFDSLVAQKIIRPLQLKNTGVQLSGAQNERFASGYNQNGEATPAWNLDAFAAAGDLRSSTEDMLHYLQYQLKEPDAAVKLTHQMTYKDHEALGLAWFIKKTNSGNTLLWHNGGTYGFSSFAGFVKEKNCAIVILTNSSGSVDHIALAILKYMQGS